MALRFGTDGVRGPADELTDELVAALGRAAVRVLGGGPFVIGRDTRESGPRIERALAAGMVAEGAEVESLGVAPTPAVAWVSADRTVPAAMISASHNPYGDNGIKLFAAGGRKLPDAVEERLEAELDRLAGDPVSTAADLHPSAGAVDLERYDDAVVGSLEGRSLEGLHVVIDCANGAATTTAPRILARLGVRLEVLHADPDGRNINEGCGSTHPDDLRRAVVAAGADLGLAFDGDADRVLAVDERGELVDGDQLIAMCAVDLRDQGRLRADTVVVTVMSNLGFRRAMAAAGIAVRETAVGDRYVLEALDAEGLSLGGEQSGHVIFHDLAATGDGVLTGVQVLDLRRRSGRPLSELAAVVERVPQVLENVRVARRDPGLVDRLAPAIAAEEAALGDSGRILVRPSGTELLVRVMVEAVEPGVAADVAGRLAAAVEAAADTA